MNTKLSLVITKPIRMRIEWIRGHTNAKTTSDVFKEALGVYDHIVHCVHEGSTIIIRKKDGTETELVI